MAKPRPERVNPDIAALAYEASTGRNERDRRQRAFSNYIALRWRMIGQFGPGCDAKDFYAYLDERMAEEVKPDVAPVD